MKKICFLIGFTPNPRIKKRINALRSSYDVELIYWEKSDAFAYGSILPDIPCHAIRGTFDKSSTLSRIKGTNHFATAAIKKLREINPDILFVQNIDMLSIANFYCRRRKIPIVYEIADIRAMLTEKQSGIKAAASCALRFADRVYSQNVRLFICTSPLFYKSYYHTFIPQEKMLFLPNVPDLQYFEQYRKTPHDSFTVGYIGSVRYKEQMKMLIEAARGTGIKVFFAGSEVQDDSGISIKELAAREDHVSYLGAYDYETDIYELYERADAIYSVYDTSVQNTRIALPNKLYEAITCELPLIVARGTYLSELVKEKGIGLSVSDSDTEELRAALLRLAEDKAMYERICTNCRREKARIDPNANNAELLARIQQIE